jgi:DNA polymerase (family 10)
MLYLTAKKWATDICDQLIPHCDRIEPAGSIRRHEPLCGDIDLVCQCTSQQRAVVRARCLKSNPEIRQDGDSILSIVLNNGIRVQINFVKRTETDLFEETPGNWGSIMLCRTGPKEFNQSICLRAAVLGLHWNPFYGIYERNRLIASATEEDIFKALKWRFIEPRHRSRIRLTEVIVA